jgi:hypothetical protein
MIEFRCMMARRLDLASTFVAGLNRDPKPVCGTLKRSLIAGKGTALLELPEVVARSPPFFKGISILL